LFKTISTVIYTYNNCTAILTNGTTSLPELIIFCSRIDDNFLLQRIKLCPVRKTWITKKDNNQNQNVQETHGLICI